MAKRNPKTATQILDQWDRDDADMQQLLKQARFESDVAQLIYDARTAAGLTQQQLAELVGTSQPNIARLENADYEGHSMPMVKRIADALHLRLLIALVPKDDEEQEAA